MTKERLRWFLWVAVTISIIATATIQGFVSALWEQDVTRISLGILACYLGTTIWLFWERDDYTPALFLSDAMERAGIFGTFVGLIIAFQALRHSGQGDGWKDELLSGVSTKFLTSITGIAAAFFLRTQVRLRGVRE